MKIIKKYKRLFRQGSQIQSRNKKRIRCVTMIRNSRELVIKFRNLVTSIHRLSDISPEQQTRIFAAVRDGHNASTSEFLILCSTQI